MLESGSTQVYVVRFGEVSQVFRWLRTDATSAAVALSQAGVHAYRLAFDLGDRVGARIGPGEVRLEAAPGMCHAVRRWRLKGHGELQWE